jgi:hypothetical protein
MQGQFGILGCSMGLAEKVKGWLHRQLDSSTSFVLERALQRRLERYGRMLNFQIDSQRKTARCEVLLKGERDPITVSIDEYELRETGSGLAIVVHKATVSREWMNQLIEDYLCQREWPLPPQFAKWAKLLA